MALVALAGPPTRFPPVGASKRLASMSNRPLAGRPEFFSEPWKVMAVEDGPAGPKLTLNEAGPAAGSAPTLYCKEYEKLYTPGWSVTV